MQTSISASIREALEEGQGVLCLAPCWVPRSFLIPGRRIKLDPRDLYAFGANRGGIDERWFASTTGADNGPGTLPDEGLSYVVAPAGKVLLRDAVEAEGAAIIGERLMDRYGGWPVYSKFFDNMGPIHHHLHMREEHARLVNRRGKPESYYFPVQLNAIRNNFPFTFFGLEPGTTKADVRRCLERWNEGDNGILDLSRAYRLEAGTGWFVPGGVLHAPGSLVTYEPQWGSDVGALFQSLVESRPTPWALLVKDVPPERAHDLDFIVDLIDWEENVRPDFKAQYFRPPRVDAAASGQGYSDCWISYDNGDLFSAKELTVAPGVTMTLRDPGASGVVAVQGSGKLGPWDVQTPAMIRFGELTRDEFFITESAASAGVVITNSGHEPLVLLRYFGPGAEAQSRA